MSRATSFASVAQQVSISTGVAIGALVLETMRATRGGGHELMTSDFSVAFLVVSAISMMSVFFFFKLPDDAGSELSGRGPKPPDATPPTAPDARGEVGTAG